MKIPETFRAFLEEEEVRIDHMVHFPCSGNGCMPPSSKMDDMLMWDDFERLPEAIQKVLAQAGIEDLWDFDVIGDALTNANLEGWLVCLATPVRSYYADDGTAYTASWGLSTSKTFFVQEWADLEKQALDWIVRHVQMAKSRTGGAA